MRYIDLELLVGDEEAQPAIDAAQAAKAELLNAAPEDREKLINNHRTKWVAFREHFQRIYGEKCWYTECKNPGTDDDIDHYRPKGSLAEDEEHGGYWWEALSWRNFRLSCHRANRLRGNPETGETHGKGDHFPLLPGTIRWSGPNEPCHEVPTLLDPTCPGDSDLITFDIKGRVALSPKYANDDDAKVRFSDSRIYLHLDWPKFCNDRKFLYAEIARRMDEGNEAAAASARGDAGGRVWLDRVAAALIRTTDAKMPYSRAAQAYIRCFRHLEWVERKVLPHILAAEPALELATNE